MMGYIFALLYTSVLLAFFLGLVHFLWTYLRTPVPLNIALTPGSSTVAGVLWKTAKEVLYFETLFRSSKWTWLFGWLFHFGLLFIILRHLSYFTDPVWGWVRQIEAYSDAAAVCLIVGAHRAFDKEGFCRQSALYFRSFRLSASDPTPDYSQHWDADDTCFRSQHPQSSKASSAA